MIFQIPHTGFDEYYIHVQWIDNPHFEELYRVQTEHFRYFYTTEVIFTNACYNPEGEVETPCGPTVLDFGDSSDVPLIKVQYKGVNEKAALADKIMGTIKIIDYKPQY